MTTELRPPETQEEWSELLDMAAKDMAAKGRGAAGGAVGLAEMLGDYTPMADILGRACGPLFVKKPKLRQKLAMARDFGGEMKIPDDPIEQLEWLVRACTHVCFVHQNGGMRASTYDDLVDTFDSMDDATKIAEDVLDLRFAEKKGESATEAVPTTA